MRTTVDIADETYSALKVKAAHEGTSVKKLIHRAVEELLTPTRPLKKKMRSPFPIIKSKQPGTVLMIDNDVIYDAIEFP